MAENKKDPRIVIVILNYLNYKETVECVQSVLRQEYTDYHILIVDNGSANESYRSLFTRYSKEARVTVIRAGKNYGFAKGNNIGIRYARERLSADYVMLLNSDTLMEDRAYLKKMSEADTGGIGVIGSRIAERDNAKVRMIPRYVTFPGTLFYYFAARAEYRDHPLSQNFWEQRLSQISAVPVIQGCILLLTPAYFRHYEGLDPRTFLYCEEELLYLRCQKAGLKEKLNDETCIFHKYGQSSKLLHGNQRNAFLKYMLSSYKYVIWESIRMYRKRNEVQSR